MKELYYNVHEFRNAVNMMELDPNYSLALFQEYTEKYPKDYSGYCYLAINLLMIGKVNEAEKIINSIMPLARANSRFVNDKTKFSYFKKDYAFAKLKLYCYKEEYKKAYDYILSKAEHLNIGSVFFYIKKKINKLYEGDFSKLPYIYNQIYQYSESRFIDHINKHTQDFNRDLDNPNEGYFLTSFPLQKVIEEVKKHISKENGIFKGFIEDEYTFKYTGCGKSNGKTTDYFIVDVFHNTKDFITMCPISEIKANFIDLDYLIKEDTNIKKLSQIDKFNRRFNK